MDKDTRADSTRGGIVPQLLNMREVADLLGVKSVRSVRKLVRQGRLDSVRIGRLIRIPRASLDRFIRGGE